MQLLKWIGLEVSVWKLTGLEGPVNAKATENMFFRPAKLHTKSKHFKTTKTVLCCMFAFSIKTKTLNNTSISVWSKTNFETMLRNCYTNNFGKRLSFFLIKTKTMWKILMVKIETQQKHRNHKSGNTKQQKQRNHQKQHNTNKNKQWKQNETKQMINQWFHDSMIFCDYFISK